MVQAHSQPSRDANVSGLYSDVGRSGSRGTATQRWRARSDVWPVMLGSARALAGRFAQTAVFVLTTSRTSCSTSRPTVQQPWRHASPSHRIARPAAWPPGGRQQRQRQLPVGGRGNKSCRGKTCTGKSRQLLQRQDLPLQQDFDRSNGRRRLQMQRQLLVGGQHWQGSSSHSDAQVTTKAYSSRCPSAQGQGRDLCSSKVWQTGLH